MSRLNTRKIKHDASAVDNITLDANGRVGIGTSSPTTTLEINGGTNNNIVRIVSTDANANIEFADNTTTSGCQIGANGDNIKFGISGTEVMRIDSAGRVTMPYQPAFQTSEYSPGSISAGTKYVFKTTAVHNIGNYYNSTNGKFTAPVAGMYNFSFVVTPSSATSSPAVWIRLNNGSTRYGLCLAYNSSYNGVSCSPNIYMNINDYVEPIIEEWNGGTALAIWSAQFGGFLIG